MISYIEKNPWILYLAGIILLFPALLINLGMMPVTSDEQIRGLVALEMLINDDWIVPTMYGEYYLKKPPLYNWILISYTTLFGNFDEFTLRLSTVVSTILFAVSIFLIFRKHFGNQVAFINAIAFVTCGRMLFWDTQLALIDITFSWVVFMNFMAVYHFYNKSNYWALFLVSYLLAALGYLFKGLPAIVFQGITLLVFFIYQKEFRKLFSPAHFAGIFVFLIIVGGYYLMYFSRYDGTARELFQTLFDESSRRTVMRFGVLETIVSILKFPVDMIYHFAPWALMIICCFRKDFFRILWKKPFLKFNFIIVLANLIVYWTSPEVHARYLLMFVPMAFGIFFFFYNRSREEGSIYNVIIGYGLFAIGVVASIGTTAVFFIDETKDLPWIVPKFIFLFLGMGILSYLMLRLPVQRLLIFALIMLIMRIGFNWTVIPARYQLDRGIPAKEGAVRLARLAGEKPLYVLGNSGVDDFSAFYITRERWKILPKRFGDFFAVDENTCYIADNNKLFNKEYRLFYSYNTHWQERKLKLVKLLNEDPDK
jgi:4-amino-4-deoxy-L-arabinose transferase-like glycosyltransferase